MTRGVVLLAVIGAEKCPATLAAPGARPTHNVFASCRDQAELTAFLRKFLDDAGNPLLIGAALAASGPEHDGVIAAGLAHWPLDRRMLRRVLDTPHVQLVQGVVACALAAPGLDPGTLRALHEAPLNRDAAVAAVLPELELGVAFLFTDARGERVAVQSDAGCIHLTPADSRDAAVLAQLSPAPLAAGTMLSDAGFIRIHQAVCALAGGPPDTLTSPAIMRLARAGDAHAAEAVRLYCGWLGAFASDIALIGRTRGGVYLNSLFLREMGELIDGATFAARYLDKNRAAGGAVEDSAAFVVSAPTALDGLATLFTPSDARFGQKDVHLLDC